jgi:hypothetical protein
MALANVTSRRLRCLVGNDSQDWSASVGPFRPQFDSLSESGLIFTTAELELQRNLLNPESLNPRANPSRWKPGTAVHIEVRDTSGDYQDWGTLRILDATYRAGILTLSLGCWLAWANSLEPEDDQSGITLGTGQNSAAVASTLLEAAGIPTASISLSGWEYSLAYPLQKDDPSSFVTQAGRLAWANDCRYLYQNSAGVIVAGQWDGSSGTPIHTITLGTNDRLFEAFPDAIQPVERVQVDGLGYLVNTLPSSYGSSSSVAGDVAEILDPDPTLGVGTYRITATEINSYDTSGDPYVATREIRTTQPRALTYIGSDSLFTATSRHYEIWKYDATTKRLIEQREYEIADVETVLGPEFTTFTGGGSFTAVGTVKLFETVTTPTYNADEALIKLATTTTQLRTLVDGNLESGTWNDQVTTETVTQTWAEERPDYWVERTDRKRIAAQANRRTNAGVNPLALLPEPPEQRTNSRPPATQYWEDPATLEEVHFQGVATWTHPGGATGRTRTRRYTVEPGFSNAQCFTIAVATVELLEGRAEGYVIECPVADALLWCPPLSLISVDDGENLWTFRADALLWEFLEESATVGCAGITVARAASAAGSGAELPDYASGLDAEQSAAAEPTPLPVPVDSARDVDHVVGLSSLSFAAAGEVETPEDDVSHAATLGRMAAAASVGPVVAAQHGATLGNMAAAANLTDADIFEHAVTLGRMAAAGEVAPVVGAAHVATLGKMAAAGSVEGGSTLLNDLTAWWSLDEASGNRADSHTNLITLAENGTVGSAVGKISNAASFAGNSSNYLESSATELRFSSTFYIALWIYPTVNSGAQAYISRYDFTNSARSYYVGDSNGKFAILVSNDGATGTINSHPLSFSTNTWYFLEAYYNAATDETGIAVNGGSFTTVSHTGGLFNPATTPVRVGQHPNGQQPAQGRIDEIGIWNRILTTAERTELYNSGNGIAYPG